MGRDLKNQQLSGFGRGWFSILIDLNPQMSTEEVIAIVEIARELGAEPEDVTKVT